MSAAEDADAVNGNATFTVSSTGLPTVNVDATEADNDTLNLVVSPTAVTVAEGGTATVSVRLSAQPGVESVMVSTSRSSGDSDLSVSGGATLTFTTENWNTPQSVTLSAARRSDADNSTATFIVSSVDLPTISVTATEADNNTQVIILSTTNVTVEEGGTGSFTVRLAAQPSSDLTVNTMWVSGDSDLSVSGGATLAFRTANWSTPQSVILSAAEDTDTLSGAATFTVSFPGLATINVAASEIDNDTLALVVLPTVVTVAEGGTANFTVRLSAQPGANVNVMTSRSIGDADLSVSDGATLAFTTANWNAPQTVTLSAMEDADAANGSATFALDSAGLTTVNVTATKASNDHPRHYQFPYSTRLCRPTPPVRDPRTGRPTHFDASGLPPGLSVDHTSGVITGTPTTNGTFAVVLSANNALAMATAELLITVDSSATGILIYNRGFTELGESSDVFVSNLDGSYLRRLTFDGVSDAIQVVRHTGEIILKSRDENNIPTIETIMPDGSGRQMLFPLSDISDWWVKYVATPDGQKFLRRTFLNDGQTPGAHELALLNRDGTLDRVLTSSFHIYSLSIPSDGHCAYFMAPHPTEQRVTLSLPKASTQLISAREERVILCRTLAERILAPLLMFPPQTINYSCIAMSKLMELTSTDPTSTIWHQEVLRLIASLMVTEVCPVGVLRVQRRFI